jgi:hypothetical protein
MSIYGVEQPNNYFLQCIPKETYKISLHTTEALGQTNSKKINPSKFVWCDMDCLMFDMMWIVYCLMWCGLSTVWYDVDFKKGSKRV